jgi:hypothetical protein
MDGLKPAYANLRNGRAQAAFNTNLMTLPIEDSSQTICAVFLFIPEAIEEVGAS